MTASTASADWVVTPFVGGIFGTQSQILILEQDATKGVRLTVGGSVGFMSRGVWGGEGEVAFAPRFFERDSRGGNLTKSSLTTLSGSLIAAIPVRVTRESLRPYGIVGLGIIHPVAQDVLDLFPVDETFAGWNAGAGVIGFLTPRTGLRFEVRHFRSVADSKGELTGQSGVRLGFWRLTAGVVMRLGDGQ